MSGDLPRGVNQLNGIARGLPSSLPQRPHPPPPPGHQQGDHMCPDGASPAQFPPRAGPFYHELHPPKPHHKSLPFEAPVGHADRQPGGRVEIADLRNRYLTDSDARQRLTKIFIIRIEKIDDLNEVDEDGSPLRPTWKYATQTDETDTVTQPEAKRRLRELQNRNQSISEEKKFFSTALQHQMVDAQDRLEQRERDQRYSYNLLQIESQHRKVRSYVVPLANSSKSRKSKYFVEDRKKSKKEKSVLERIAVTVYFARSPRQDQDAIEMLLEIEAEKQTQMLGQMSPPRAPPPPPPGHIAPMVRQHSGPINSPPVPPFPASEQVGEAAGRASESAKERIEVIVTDDRRARRYSEGTSSHSSHRDDEDFWLDCEGISTPRSSIGSTRRYLAKQRYSRRHEPFVSTRSSSREPLDGLFRGMEVIRHPQEDHPVSRFRTQKPPLVIQVDDYRLPDRYEKNNNRNNTFQERWRFTAAFGLPKVDGNGSSPNRSPHRERYPSRKVEFDLPPNSYSHVEGTERRREIHHVERPRERWPDDRAMDYMSLKPHATRSFLDEPYCRQGREIFSDVKVFR